MARNLVNKEQLQKWFEELCPEYTQRFWITSSKEYSLLILGLEDYYISIESREDLINLLYMMNLIDTR